MGNMLTHVMEKKRGPVGPMSRMVRRKAGPSAAALRTALRAQRAEDAQVREILRGPRMQTKLKVNQPGDPYEQEADRVADQVMRMPDSAVQRKPT